MMYFIHTMLEIKLKVFLTLIRFIFFVKALLDFALKTKHKNTKSIKIISFFLVAVIFTLKGIEFMYFYPLISIGK